MLIVKVHQPLTDFCPDHEVHIDEVVKQRQQLQHLEVNLKAQILVMGMRERFNSQIQEQIDSNAKLQVCWAILIGSFVLYIYTCLLECLCLCVKEQLHEREKAIMDLQTTLDDKDKELHVIKLEHEAVCA